MEETPHTSEKRRRIPTIHLLWIPAALVVSFGVYFLLQFGLKPKPIPQINPTQFESPEQIGAVTFRHLGQTLRQEKLLVIGSSPWNTEYDRVWNGFVAAARADKLNVRVIFQDESLKPIKKFDGVDYKPLIANQTNEQWRSELEGLLKAGDLVILHTTYNHSSHRGETSLTKDLEAVLQRPWMTVSMMSLATNTEEIGQLQPHCADELAPISQQDYMACSAVRISRKFLRKKLAPQFLWAALERHGLRDYLLFVHQPTAETQ